MKEFRDGYEKLVSNCHDSDTVPFEQRIQLCYEFSLNHTMYECDPFVASTDMRDKVLCNIFSRLLSKGTLEKFRVVVPCDSRTNDCNYFSRTSLTNRLKILHRPNVGTFLLKPADIPIGKNKDRYYQHPSPSFFLELITLPFSLVFPSKYTNS